jgi:DNA-binding response OmpR family regulator
MGVLPGEPVAAVLVIEDDQAVAEPLVRALRHEGYAVDHAWSGSAALEQLERCPPDLLVLDLGLPEVDGLEVCRLLRATGVHVPVLMLTARTGEIDAVAGLDAGADDYVTKPFRLGELLARVRALLRRRGGEAGSSRVLGAADVLLDLSSRRVALDGEEVVLSHKEFDLLAALLRRAGTVVSREQLMREVWQTAWMGSSKTLDMHVSWLRRKLGDDAANPRYITTVRGVGFRFER